jgi:nucleotide-binding universal stress UspA family protein
MGLNLPAPSGWLRRRKPCRTKSTWRDTLIDTARERGAAVIVVGSHGISGLPTRLLGSVSRKLIQHCDRPVLVIRDDSA